MRKIENIAPTKSTSINCLPSEAIYADEADFTTTNKKQKAITPIRSNKNPEVYTDKTENTVIN